MRLWSIDICTQNPTNKLDEEVVLYMLCWRILLWSCIQGSVPTHWLIHGWGIGPWFESHCAQYAYCLRTRKGKYVLCWSEAEQTLTCSSVRFSNSSFSGFFWQSSFFFCKPRWECKSLILYAPCALHGFWFVLFCWWSLQSSLLFIELALNTEILMWGSFLSISPDQNSSLPAHITGVFPLHLYLNFSDADLHHLCTANLCGWKDRQSINFILNNILLRWWWLDNCSEVVWCNQN